MLFNVPSLCVWSWWLAVHDQPPVSQSQLAVHTVSRLRHHPREGETGSLGSILFKIPRRIIGHWHWESLGYISFQGCSLLAASEREVTLLPLSGLLMLISLRVKYPKCISSAPAWTRIPWNCLSIYKYKFIETNSVILRVSRSDQGLYI